VRVWEFSGQGGLHGWSVPAAMGGQVRGGALWLRPTGEYKGNISFAPFSGLNRVEYQCQSPRPLGVPAVQARKLKLRLLNASPETDLHVEWITLENPDAKPFQGRAALRPFCRDWQEIVVHLDEVAWTGTLDQIGFSFAKSLSGDVFVASIAVTGGEPRLVPARPDIRGSHGIPVVTVPGITQEQVAAAYDVLVDAVVHDPLPINGFPTPFLAPGAGGDFYGNNWWVLDASLAMPPVLWTDFKFCSDMLRGFMAVQAENPDGNINHEGKIAWRGTPCDLSVIPRYFEAAHAVVRMSDDAALRAMLYDSMRRHLGWWLSPVKRDTTTGLVTAYFEETFTCHSNFKSGEVAAVDTNVAVAVGAWLTAEVAEWVGRHDEAAAHRAVFGSIREAINGYLWNDALGCYQNWMIKEGRHLDLLANHMFDPLQLRIAPPERVERLLQRLLDPAQFGWGGIGLMTLAPQDRQHKVARGHYDGKAWDGGVWTMRNLPVIAGLRDCGRCDLAAELAWQTIRLFAGNYAEWLEQEGGTGQGVKRYSWTAGQWLQTIIEHLFGVTYNARTKTLQIRPNVPTVLRGQTLTLSNLRLPSALEYPIEVRVGNDNIEVDGAPPGIRIQSRLFSDTQEKREGRDDNH